MSQKQAFTQGDKVEWNSGGGKSQGEVQERITESQTVDGKQVSASKDDPRYLVENDSTGNVSGHRKSALSKSSSGGSSSESSSSDAFEPGDEVKWNSAQGEIEGKVETKLTSETKIKGHKVRASEENPEYLVKSDNTGSKAAHKPDALESI